MNARAEEQPGGAAHVARNVAILNAQATLLSATGVDERTDTLLRMLRSDGIRTSFLRDAALTTSIKLHAINHTAREQ